MKKEIILSIVLVVCLFLFGITIFNTSTKEKKIDDADFRASYLNGCVGGPATFSFCNCTYEEMKKDLGLDGLISMSENSFNSKTLPSRAKSYALRCIDKLQE